ncbi:MAG: hypothetical protein ACPGFA_04315, partial [Pikeienuella sp.]
MMRLLVVLAIASVVAVGGCGRKNPPEKPVAKTTATEGDARVSLTCASLHRKNAAKAPSIAARSRSLSASARR